MNFIWFSQRKKITPPLSTEQMIMNRRGSVRPAHHPRVQLWLEPLGERICPSGLPPVASDTSASVLHDHGVAIDLMALGSDPENDPLELSIVNQAAHGYVDQDYYTGEYWYWGDYYYAGPDSFTFQFWDGTQYSNVATVNITVTNQAPTATGTSISLDQGQSVGMNLHSLGYDADGDALSLVIVNQPVHGYVYEDYYTGLYWYIPPYGYSGPDSFSLKFNDGVADSNVATVTIEIINLSPSDPFDSDGTANIVDEGAIEGTPVGITAYATDPGEDPLTYTLTDDAGGRFSIDPATGVVTVASSEIVDFEFSGGSYNLKVQASDGNLSSNEISFIITVNDVNEAPVASQTLVYLTAENQLYNDIDFSVNGWDPDGDTITFQVVDSPSYGSLVYDSSTELYNYQANTSYFGIDTFSYFYSDGTLQSELVTVKIFVYETSVDPLDPIFQSFEILAGGVFDGAGGLPGPMSVQQGSIENCWLIAPIVGLANVTPNSIVGMIVDNLNGTYTVTFTGQAAITITTPVGDGNTYSSSDGDWLAILQKAAGQYYFNNRGVFSGGVPYDYINTGGFGSSGISLITGSSVDTDWFWCTYNSTTRTKLATAFAANANKIVTAATTYPSSSTGLVQTHVYTVLQYDATNDRVQLRNPWGSNPAYSVWVNNQAGGEPHWENYPNGRGTGGVFWLTVNELSSMFGEISYQQ